MSAKRAVKAKNQELYVGLVRLHVLHHAAEEPVYGLGMMQELGRHGYRLGPGMMYPLLHGMERKGWLKPESRVAEGRRRKVYMATAEGRKALAQARVQVRELFEEMCEGK
ncbi:MAG TPA: PadR family transcriptional regulator [Acidobacteriaceae bacterium]|nr:PadR family transcriptional regulator [Acidobacteriaceae bacterium]